MKEFNLVSKASKTLIWFGHQVLIPSFHDHSMQMLLVHSLKPIVFGIHNDEDSDYQNTDTE